jgi:hypothetical protein
VRAEPSERRATLPRLAISLLPATIGLLSLVIFRPESQPGEVLHWEPLARRALILPRVLWSGSTLTRWLGNVLVAAGLIASVRRFRTMQHTERAYVLSAWSALLLLVALPIVIPGWQFFNVRFAPFVVVFALPLLPIERLRRPLVESAACAIGAACFIASAFGFHRSLRASCADDLAGLALPITRSAFRLPMVLEPVCGLPRDATKSPVPFLAPARQLAALYAAQQGGTIPDAFASTFAIHPFKVRRGEDAPRVPIPEHEVLRFGEEPSRLANPRARTHALQTIAIHAPSYEDVLLFGAVDADVATLGELGLRTTFRQGTFAMLQLEPCTIEVVVEDRERASAITIGGGIAGRNEIIWERRAKPGLPSPGADGDIVLPSPQRLCGPGWIRGRYQVGDVAIACGHTADGTVPYVAKPGEVTRVRCSAPDL